MRYVWLILLLLPVLLLAYLIAWMTHRSRRLAASAVLAGLAVGQTTAGVAW